MANDKATVNHSYEDWYKTIMGYERSYKRWEARADARTVPCSRVV